jgi:hypothetical protein
VSADAQHVTAGHQTRQFAGGAINDRHTADVQRDHAIRELADQLLRVSDADLTGIESLAQCLSARPAPAGPAQGIGP